MLNQSTSSIQYRIYWLKIKIDIVWSTWCCHTQWLMKNNFHYYYFQYVSFLVWDTPYYVAWNKMWQLNYRFHSDKNQRTFCIIKSLIYGSIILNTDRLRCNITYILLSWVDKLRKGIIWVVTTDWFILLMVTSL